MAIPEAQLETWSHQGSVTQSSDTYNTIKNVLEAEGTPYAGKPFSVFLQGSYGNDTNIWSESDVDIVIQNNGSFYKDLTKLAPDQVAAFNGYFQDATYGHNEFRRDVLAALRARFGRDVEEGEKAIAIAANGARRKADVIVATQHRRYQKFLNSNDQEFDEGIAFYTRSGVEIVNYPRVHSANLTAKHQATQGRLKPTVRIFKNLRGRMVEDGVVQEGSAPSYFIEGLIYNVPDDRFVRGRQETVENVLDWLLNEADLTKLVCANRRHWLMRDNSRTCWNCSSGEGFIAAANAVWDEWR